MKLIFYFSTLLFLLLSCKQPEGKATLKAVGETTYQVGYEPRWTHYFKDKEQEYVAFGEFETFKTIKIFNVYGKNIYTLSLTDFTKTNGVILEDFCMVNLDTIALLAKHNLIFLLDNKGTLLRKIDYSKYIVEGIELDRPLFIKNNIIRCGIAYNDFGNPITMDYKYYHDFFARNDLFYQLMIDTIKTNPENELQPVFMLDSLFTRFIPKDHFHVESTKITFTEKENIYQSNYTDSVYHYDLNGHLKQIHTIKSNYFNTKLTPVSVRENYKNNRAFQENIYNGGYISKLLWDNTKELYYCTVIGKWSPETRDNIPFSIIVLDKNFNKLDEFLMDEQIYRTSMFVNKNGLNILTNKSTFKQKIYTTLRYE